MDGDGLIQLPQRSNHGILLDIYKKTLAEQATLNRESRKPDRDDGRCSDCCNESGEFKDDTPLPRTNPKDPAKDVTTPVSSACIPNDSWPATQTRASLHA